jgi:UDP-N-acetylmuramate dehydrogenase
MKPEDSIIVKNYDSSKISWLKSGGMISQLIKFKNLDDLQNNKELLTEQNTIPIGNFSNLLIKDGGFDGLAIKLGGDFAKIKIENDFLIVGSAVLDNYFSKYCYQQSIQGYEFLFTIPGTIGGNIYMNAGCYGKEIKDNLISILFYDIKSKSVKEERIENLDFSYRKGFQRKNTIILFGKFKKKFGDQTKIKSLMEVYDQNRLDTQPQKVNCCGSIFKNPPNHNAWKLIKSSLDQSFYEGPIRLSKKHSNFFENDPYISADKVINFIEAIKAKVQQKHQIKLDQELIIV